MRKFTTSHGTYYLVDEANYRAKRVKAENRNGMHGDGDWFEYSSITSWDSENGEYRKDLVIGYPLFFNMVNHPEYHWRISTRVISIEDVEEFAEV
jgi:hypothetical protein